MDRGPACLQRLSVWTEAPVNGGRNFRGPRDPERCSRMSVSTLGLLLARGKRGSVAWLSSARAVKSRGECSLQDFTQHLMARARPSQYRLRRLRTRTLCVHQPGRSVYFVAFTGSPTFDQHEEVRCGLVQRILALQPWSIWPPWPPRPPGWPSTSFYADQLRGLLDR